MAKRGSEQSLDTIEVKHAFIKGYHDFKIKLPVGCRVNTRPEPPSRERKDEKAMICVVPGDLPEDILDSEMSSKSSGTTYRVRDVVGKTVGRVQYFLAGAFMDLLHQEKVQSITGIVTGQPTASRKPRQHQRWVRGHQAGGGAVIPVTWQLQLSASATAEAVAALLKALPEVEGHEDMDVVISSSKKSRK